MRKLPPKVSETLMDSRIWSYPGLLPKFAGKPRYLGGVLDVNDQFGHLIGQTVKRGEMGREGFDIFSGIQLELHSLHLSLPRGFLEGMTWISPLGTMPQKNK
jgi:hypothetical protein